MKRKQILSLMLAMVLLLTACGGASAPSKNFAMMEESAAEAPAMMADGAMDMLTTNTADTSVDVPENRKWIITVYMSAETEDLDALTGALNERIGEMKGYVEDQRIFNGSFYSERRYRNANLTIRIPAEDVDAFTQQIAGIANVVSQEKNLEDVTLNYVSTESRMKALQTEEARLLELMEQAQTMSDLLEIERRLTDVRYELESTTSRLHTYDNQINYATIYLDISEVQEYTPVKDPTLWERIRDGFKDSLEGLRDNLQDLLVFLITASPFLLVYGAIAAAIIVLIRKIRRSDGRKSLRKRFGKKEPKQEE